MSARSLLLILTILAGLAVPQLVRAELIGDQFQVSQVGTDGDVARDADYPSAAYSSASNRSLMVWSGVFGQRLAADGTALGRALTLAIDRKRLRLTKKRARLVITASCDEACEIAYSGNISTKRSVRGMKKKPRAAGAHLAATEKRRLVITLTKKQTAKLRAALRRRGSSGKTLKAYLKFAVTATDMAGNMTTKRLSLRVVR